MGVPFTPICHHTWGLLLFWMCLWAQQTICFCVCCLPCMKWLHMWGIYYTANTQQSVAFVPKCYREHNNHLSKWDLQPVLPVRFLSLDKFHQILQIGGGVLAPKSLALTENCIFFTHSHKIFWANISKCWANFLTHSLKENTYCSKVAKRDLHPLLFSISLVHTQE